jgi:hypothetical protein
LFFRKTSVDPLSTHADNYTHPTLDRYGLIINTVHQCLVCVECGAVIDHRKVRPHVVKEHKQLKPPKDLDETLERTLTEWFPKLTYPPKHPTVSVVALYGLKDAVGGYGVCDVCHKGYKVTDGSGAFRKHTCHPGKPNETVRKWKESWVQRFETNTRSPFFAVHSSNDEGGQEEVDHWENYRKEIGKRPKRSTEMCVPENYRVLDQFLHKEQWLQHVQGLDAQKLKKLVTLTSKDPDYPMLGRHCEAYLRHHQSTLHSYHARRLISTRPR